MYMDIISCFCIRNHTPNFVKVLLIHPIYCFSFLHVGHETELICLPKNSEGVNATLRLLYPSIYLNLSVAKVSKFVSSVSTLLGKHVSLLNFVECADQMT